MLAKDIPKETLHIIELIKWRRPKIKVPTFWALVLRGKDQDGNIDSSMRAFNGPENLNEPSFWLLADMLPMSFATNQILNTAKVDLSRIDWLVEALHWVPGMSNYDMNRHVNYSVAELVCKLLKSERLLEIELTMIAFSGDPEPGLKQFFRNLASAI